MKAAARAIAAARDEAVSVSPAEAARIIGCSAPTVRGLIDAGELPSYTVGRGHARRHRRIRLAELLAWQRGER